MNNQVIGKIGSAVTGIAVLAFAVSMIVGIFCDTLFASCFASMFIAIGFVLFMASLVTANKNKNFAAAGRTGLIFAGIYVGFIFVVYFAQCTTINLHPELNKDVLSIIDYGSTGSLFFNYDLLGYGFMALSTFFTGFTVDKSKKGGKALAMLLKIHGVFFPCCLIIPMFPVFTSGTDSICGTILLEIWCAYFLPICVLGYRYFK